MVSARASDPVGSCVARRLARSRPTFTFGDPRDIASVVLRNGHDLLELRQGVDGEIVTALDRLVGCGVNTGNRAACSRKKTGAKDGARAVGGGREIREGDRLSGRKANVRLLKRRVAARARPRAAGSVLALPRASRRNSIAPGCRRKRQDMAILSLDIIEAPTDNEHGTTPDERSRRADASVGRARD
jgi:hypothetical protein